MNGASVRRSGATLASAMLLASLVFVTTAAPVAAKASCMGERATIVGTSQGEVIRGTPKRDVIAALGGDDIVYGRGGRDLICGGGGNDRLYGGPGRDMLRGMAGDDTLSGGTGKDFLWGDTGHDKLVGGPFGDRLTGGGGRDRLFGNKGGDELHGGPGSDMLIGGAGHDSLKGKEGRDTCVQGPDSGPHYSCEVVPRVKPRNLAIAWSDVNDDGRYGPGDVLISRLFDTNGDGIPSKGDTIYMGRYPLDFEMTSFGDWGVEQHEVLGRASFVYHDHAFSHVLGAMAVRTAGGLHFWVGGHRARVESYEEADGYDRYWDLMAHASFLDSIASSPRPSDWLRVSEAGRGQSLPESKVHQFRDDAGGDQPFIDVVVYP